jgi:hypothetical protein
LVYAPAVAVFSKAALSYYENGRYVRSVSAKKKVVR